VISEKRKQIIYERVNDYVKDHCNYSSHLVDSRISNIQYAGGIHSCSIGHSGYCVFDQYYSREKNALIVIASSRYKGGKQYEIFEEHRNAIVGNMAHPDRTHAGGQHSNPRNLNDYIGDCCRRFDPGQQVKGDRIEKIYLDGGFNDDRYKGQI